MQHAIEAQASDFVMLGRDEDWRCDWLAQGLRRSRTQKVFVVSNHLWPEISARLLCCTPTAHWLEYADWWNPIIAAPLRIEKGMAIVGDTFGTGVEWNEGAVSQFAA